MLRADDERRENEVEGSARAEGDQQFCAGGLFSVLHTGFCTGYYLVGVASFASSKGAKKGDNFQFCTASFDPRTHSQVQKWGLIFFINRSMN